MFTVIFRKKGEMVSETIDSLTFQGRKYVPENGDKFVAKFPVILGGRKSIRNFKESNPNFKGGFITSLELGTTMELTVPELPKGLIPDNSREIHQLKVEKQIKEKKAMEKIAVEKIITFMEEQDDEFWQEIAEKIKKTIPTIKWCTLYSTHTLKRIEWSIPEYESVFWADSIDTIRIIPDMENRKNDINLKFRMNIKYENPYCPV